MNQQRPNFNAEPLEPRRLLAGVTMLIHGNDGNITGWATAAADAIAKRTGNASQVSQYVMKISEHSNDDLIVQSLTLTKGPEFNKSSIAEAVIKLDWTAADDGSHSTNDVGKVVANYLLAKHGRQPALAELPIHLIGHSRGASLAVAITGNLALRGVWVDQNTFLDPHPVDGKNDFLFADFGDTPMRVYDNVIFSDNYYRQDGDELFGFDPDGEAVTGSHNVNLNNSVGKNYFVSAHMAVTSYYHGTIDSKALTNRDHPVLSSWYGNTTDKPARNKTGYSFSRIAAGDRAVDGLGTAFGGRAARKAVDAKGTQWSNITNITTRGAVFQAGQQIGVNFLRQDRDSASTVTMFLDRDNNPYNKNFANSMRTVFLGTAQNVTSTRVNGTTNGVAAGTYYVAVKTIDAQGQARFSYSKPITITA